MEFLLTELMRSFPIFLVDVAVEMSHFALFFNQGQCCCGMFEIHRDVLSEELISFSWFTYLCGREDL